MFVNAGGEASIEANCTMSFIADSFFQGGDAFQTDEHIVESGDHSLIYQSARLGNFCYRFDNLLPGDYYVDLHFVEIINTYGPKGMRVFNVFMQDEKASQLVELHYLDYFVKSVSRVVYVDYCVFSEKLYTRTHFVTFVFELCRSCQTLTSSPLLEPTNHCSSLIQGFLLRMMA